MKTKHTQSKVLIRSALIGLGLYLATAANAAHVKQPGSWASLDNWQNNRLFQPTPRQKVQEASGKVVIYDGLSDSTVDKALDQNFDRIQNMMFIRVIRTSHSGKPIHKQDGSVQVEDDGC